MSEQASAAEELVVLLTGIPVTSWSAQERVICCRIEVFRQGTFASGRMEGMREGVNIVERALLCTGRGVFSDGVRAACKYIRGELTQQIEQAAQGEG